ncbi:hypothetical protein NJ76_31400 [Rhodococcus sp. IITR03]|nr:hypothetical protein NJ76_31400 [Rhodococcus sp. IITR03]
MRGSKTVDQALTVLLALEARPLSASECAEATGLNRTVVHRMLSALHGHGFVRREDDLYYLGTIPLRLAENVEPELRRIARPVMEDLAALTGETVVLSVPDHVDAVTIEQAPGRRHPLRVEYELGSRRPMTKGASGRAILAFLPDSVIARVMNVYPNSDESQNASEGKKILADVRAAGFAISHDELRAGVHGIAAPVRGARSMTKASLGIITPSLRAGGLLQNVDALLRASHTISEHLVAPT